LAEKISITAKELLGRIRVEAGAAGPLSDTVNNSATGGDVSGVRINVASGDGSISIAAGSAVLVGGTLTGGSVDNVRINLGAGLSLDELEIFGGEAGEAIGSNAGGVGGSIENVTVLSSAAIEDIVFAAGDGGEADLGAAGAGGNLSKITLTSRGAIFTDSDFQAGDGGSANSAAAGGTGGLLGDIKATFTGPLSPESIITFGAGRGGSSDAVGGSGGSVQNLKLADKVGSGRYQVTAGLGGSSQQDAGDTGGAGGSITGITLAAALADVRINAAAAGSAFDPGDGGDVSKIRGTAGKLSLIAGAGGDVDAGVGGNGGDVFDVNVKATFFVQQIRGGAGGDSTTGTGGSGGNIGGTAGRVVVKGDIGNLAGMFGTAFDQMGGLFAGLGGSGATAGLNGEISGVAATRIATIIAADGGTSADLSAANAVRSLSNILAKVIGADLDGDSVFDFTDVDGGGFSLAGTDEVIDGLVLALTAGYQTATIKPTVAPDRLFLI
jgi:hypothetical protein